MKHNVNEEITCADQKKQTILTLNTVKPKNFAENHIVIRFNVQFCSSVPQFKGIFTYKMKIDIHFEII